jgi:DNA-binding IclR family transcriptional regulator
MRDRGAVGITELVEQLDVSKSTVHNHLNTMEARGYVVNDGGTYRLDLRLLSFPNTLQKSRRLYQTAKDEVDEPVERTGERSQVLVEDDGYGVCIHQQTDDRAITTNSKVGTRVTPHSSAIGKAMLAFQPEERVERILHRDGLVARTENTLEPSRTVPGASPQRVITAHSRDARMSVMVLCSEDSYLLGPSTLATNDLSRAWRPDASEERVLSPLG